MKILLLLIAFLIISVGEGNSKKVKQSLKIPKESKTKKRDKNTIEDTGYFILVDSDSTYYLPAVGDSVIFEMKDIRFAGYEKEINSTKESFIIINSSPVDISELEIEIIYQDINSRMLHKRKEFLTVDVPSGENRKIDISSWDSQKTYYYHLGNRPKKTATPYKVKIVPLRVSIKNSSRTENILNRKIATL